MRCQVHLGLGQRTCALTVLEAGGWGCVEGLPSLSPWHTSGHFLLLSPLQCAYVYVSHLILSFKQPFFSLCPLLPFPAPLPHCLTVSSLLLSVLLSLLFARLLCSSSTRDYSQGHLTMLNKRSATGLCPLHMDTSPSVLGILLF